MSSRELTYEELLERLERAEAALEALRRGEVDTLIGAVEPLVVRQKSAEDELDRLRAEAERLAAEWQATFDSSSDAIWILDAHQKVLRSNRAAEAAFRVPVEKMTGRRCWELVHGTQRPIPGCPFPSMRKSMRRESLEMQIGERWFSVTVDPLRDAAGRLTGAVHIARDITRRKRGEEALRHSEERFRMLAESSPVGIYIIQDGLFRYVNRAFTELTGYRKDEIVGRLGPVEMTHPEDRAEIAERLRRAAAGEPEKGHYEFRGLRKDGSVIYCEVHGRMTEFEGRPAFIGTIVDISERMRAEERIRESEETYRNLFHNAQVGLFRTRISDGKVLESNEQLARMFGYENREEFIKEYITSANYVDPGTRERMVEEIKSKGYIENFEARFYRKDRSIFWARYSARIYPDKGWIEGVAEDITEQKKSEEQKKRRLAEFELLNRVTSALQVARTVADAAPIFVRETLAALDFPAGSVWIYDAPSGELRMEAAEGWITGLPVKALKPDEGIAGLVFSSGKTYISEDFSTDKATHPDMKAAIPLGWGGVAVPIQALEGPAGVFFVSYPSSRRVQAEEVSLLESLARMAGIAIHRMALHDETLRKLGQLQTMRTIDQTIANILDLRFALDIICAQVQEKLAVDAVGILVYSPHELTLNWAAGRGFRGAAYRHAGARLGEDYAGRTALEQRVIVVDDIRHCEPPFARQAALAGEDFVAYAAAPLVTKGKVKGVMEVFQRSPARRGKDWLEFFESLALQAAIAIDNLQLFESLQRSQVELMSAYDAVIEGWARALDLRDKEMEGHTRRVTDLTEAVARAMGVSDPQILQMRRGALLHDVGKIGIPDSILLKPGKLTEEEWEVMRRHPRLAYEMLSAIRYLAPAVEIPYCHHEKWDGTGYPRGLKGEQIPLAARIFAVVDVYDAMTSDRPYRKARTRQEALDYIRNEGGRHFDPKVVEVFMRVVAEEETGHKS
jgi:PAS domain S-box-containing protein